MPRNTQLIEIDLRGGITTNDSPYTIGPKLMSATNSIWGYRYPLIEDEDYAGPWMHRQPQTFNVPAGAVPFTNVKTIRDLAFHHNQTVGSNVSWYPYWDSSSSLVDHQLTATPTAYTEVQNFTVTDFDSSPKKMARFISAAIGGTTIVAGDWNFFLYVKTTSNTETNVIQFRIARRVAKTGISGTLGGTEGSATRTFTITTGTHLFAPTDYTSNILTTGSIKILGQTAWITGYTENHLVQIKLTDPDAANAVNGADIPLDAIDYYMFNAATPDMTHAVNTVALSTANSVQPAFSGLNTTDRLIFETFGYNSYTSAHTITLVHGGTRYYSYFTSPPPYTTIPSGWPYVFAVGANTSNNLSYWKSSGGAELKLGSGVGTSTLGSSNPEQGCSVYWSTPGIDPATDGAVASGVGAAIFSHAEAAHVYYLLDDKDPTIDTTVHGAQSLTSKVTNCPAGAASLAIHLDRLWLLTTAATGPSKLWYTDPFDLNSIRAQNVINIDGKGVAIIPGQFGAIDNSLIPRLLVFTQTSVGVLDGDPILGGGTQASLRILRVGLGLRAPHAACITPFGVFFLGTDGDLWLIPPGANTVVPVGGSIRNLLGWNNISRIEDDRKQNNNRGSIVWYDPYLYIFPGGETSYAIVAEVLSESKLNFWGPVSTQYSNLVAVIRAPLTNFALHSDDFQSTSMHAVSVLPGGSQLRYSSVCRHTPRLEVFGTGLGRTSELQTGFINVPGHVIGLNKVSLETMALASTTTSSGVTPVWSVLATTELGVVLTGVRSPDSGPPVNVSYSRYNAKISYIQHFVFPPHTKTRGISITIRVSPEAHLGLVRALAEIHTTPAQF